MAINLKDDLASVHKADINKLCETIGIITVAGKEFVTYALANSLLMDRKQRDYGPRNISGFGSFGVIVRMNDKHERLKTIFAKKGRKKRAVNESIEDTLRDISNYAIIAAMVENNDWPNE